MKNLLSTTFGLLASLSASAATADVSLLTADSVCLQGNHVAMLTQIVDVSLSNRTAEPCRGRIYLHSRAAAQARLTLCADTLVDLAPGSALQLFLPVELPEGSHTLLVSSDEAGQHVLMAAGVDIQPLRKLHFQAILSLDMLTAGDGENTLHGSSLAGSVKIVSHDADYYGTFGGKSEADGLLLYIDDADSGERLYTKKIADSLTGYGQATTTFRHDAVFRDGARYTLTASYAMPYGLETIGSLSFTTRPGINTYWTASGQVLPLPQGETAWSVPEEAVAVDLRGRNGADCASPLDTSEANPNCLYYLDETGPLPEGLDSSRNIVRGLQAGNIRLTDGWDFFCPMKFSTQFIAYVLTPSYDNPDDELRGRGFSQTIVLPFSVSHVALYDVNGSQDMLHADMLKVLRYLGNDGDSLHIEMLNDVTQMQAYEPYILGAYIGSRLLFVGQDKTVPATCTAMSPGSDIDFVGTTVGRSPQRMVYQYNATDNSFMPSHERIAPFRAYMDRHTALPAGEGIYLSASVWGAMGNPAEATAISDPRQLTRSSNPRTVCYTLCGQRVAESTAEGQQHTSLPPGVYIVGGRKVVVSRKL